MRVFIVFKTHLDLGFTDLARAVVARYFDEFIPHAVRVAAELRARGGPRFVWTTGSWLIYEYLEQADRLSRQRLEDAIIAGDIAWHGLPFTTHSELMPPALFRHGLSLSQRLDIRFGRRTVSAKLTDVPGHTRAMIPMLADAAIEFLHIGINPAATPPRVPPLFRWQHPTGASLTVMYDKGDYGQTTRVPARELSVSFAHTRDNEPPQSAQQVQEVYDQLRTEFPGATLRAASLCEVAHELRDISQDLPVVEAEIGDSWIYGAASDPLRTTPYRAAVRLFVDWQAAQSDGLAQEALDRFGRELLLVPEHTWGLWIESLEDETSLCGQPFQQLRESERGQRMEASWDEQRSQVDRAVDTLSGAPRTTVQRAIADGRATRWTTSDWTLTAQRSWQAPRFACQLSHNGALTTLRCLATDREWASVDAPLGQFRYESFAATDYARFFDQYVTQEVDWARHAYTREVPESCMAQRWLPTLSSVHERQDEAAFELLCELTLPDEAIRRFGAPNHVQLRWTFPVNESRVGLAVQWFGKSATRLPTAAWVGFVPVVAAPATWSVHKMGEWIPTSEVIAQGGRLLHGCDHGVRYGDRRNTLSIDSLDAAVVAVRPDALLHFDERPPCPEEGMHFCLWNNAWNTNFPTWHDRDERYRFELSFDAATNGG
ncbi:MAG: DUF5054 domain-containing protein [Planctomycetota bacterium]